MGNMSEYHRRDLLDFYRYREGLRKLITSRNLIFITISAVEVEGACRELSLQIPALTFSRFSANFCENWRTLMKPTHKPEDLIGHSTYQKEVHLYLDVVSCKLETAKAEVHYA